jgi:hypothetical protein
MTTLRRCVTPPCTTVPVHVGGKNHVRTQNATPPCDTAPTGLQAECANGDDLSTAGPLPPVLSVQKESNFFSKDLQVRAQTHTRWIGRGCCL